MVIGPSPQKNLKATNEATAPAADKHPDSCCKALCSNYQTNEELSGSLQPKYNNREDATKLRETQNTIQTTVDCRIGPCSLFLSWELSSKLVKQ